ncbi:MAG: hypothetical protein PHC49_19100 [Desulfuromonadaceae bacterium]|nr:hypothetical protein [Desulfuromonadaceae bacterium]
MNSTTESRSHGVKQGMVSCKATWKALLGMSFTHFPLILPGVHPLVAPLVMFRLKRRGFSNCRVEVSGSGLVVYADR